MDKFLNNEEQTEQLDYKIAGYALFTDNDDNEELRVVCLGGGKGYYLDSWFGISPNDVFLFWMNDVNIALNFIRGSLTSLLTNRIDEKEIITESMLLNNKFVLIPVEKTKDSIAIIGDINYE